MAHVQRSRVIDAPFEQVWRTLRDFNGLTQWHPAIAGSVIEGGGPADAVGCVRHLTLGDGAEIREQLVALSDLDYRYQYRILESPLPITNYLASVTLRPVTHGDQSHVDWAAQFDVGTDDQAAVLELLGDGVFAAGLEGLAEFFA